MVKLIWKAELLDPAAAALSGKAEVGRHFLEGQPVHSGDVLEMQLDDGSWAAGRYEWAHTSTDSSTGAVFRFGDTGLSIGDNQDFRWPRNS